MPWVRRDWFRWPRAVASTPADSRRRALREVDRLQGTIPKLQACEQLTQPYRRRPEPDPRESPTLRAQADAGAEDVRLGLNRAWRPLGGWPKERGSALRSHPALSSTRPKRCAPYRRISPAA